MASIQKLDVQAAADAGVIQPSDVERLWDFLEKRGAASDDSKPRFSFTHVLYYLGGMIAIGAMSLFMTLGWESFGGWGLFFISLLYAGAALKAATVLEKRGLHIPAGIMVTFVVVLLPLATYGVVEALELWPMQSYRDYHYYVDRRWLLLELVTFLIGTLMLYRYRYPFLVMPLAVTLWYFSMDVLPSLIIDNGSDEWFQGTSWHARQWISIGFGVVMLIGASYVDLRSRFSRDYAFWLYLFGLLTAWGALSSMDSGSLVGKLLYLAINVGLVLYGAIVVRRAFTIFGGVGIALVLGDLSYQMFKDSIAFPIALTVLGFAIIGVGLWWQKNQTVFSKSLRAMLPKPVQELVEVRHAR